MRLRVPVLIPVVELEGSRFELEITSWFSLHHFYLGDIHIEIHIRPESRCELADEAIPCLHQACRTACISQLSEDLVAATAFSFPPEDSEVERRKEFLRTEFAICSTRQWPGQLPHELWLLVAEQFSLKEFAALRSERLRILVSEPGETLLNLSLPIYVSYVEIEGISYIQSLSNSDNETALPIIPRAYQRIDIGEDYLGVRQLRFCSEGSLLTVPESAVDASIIWWTHVSAGQMIRVSYDVRKFSS